MLRDRLVAFFAANPEDELTIADIEVKFGAPYQTTRGVVDNMRRVGLLASVRSKHDAGAPLILTIGPELAAMVGRGPNVRAKLPAAGSSNTNARPGGST